MKALSLCVLVLVVATLAGSIAPAGACSCIPPNPWRYLQQADGAFVGRLVSREETSNGRAVLVFSVERSVKGRLGATVEVETANNGAACGIETSVGQRIGLFLMREGGRWTGHLCWQVSPEDLLAAASLPTPNGRGDVALLVGGRFGAARTLALDGQGRTLGYGLGGGKALAFSVCPGGRRAAELVEQGSRTVLAIRELPSLAPVRQQPVPPASRLACTHPWGERVVAFDGPGRGARLLRVTRTRTTTIWDGAARFVSLGKRIAHLQAVGAGRTVFVAVDVRTGSARTLGAMPFRATGPFSPNPSGTTLAGATIQDAERRLIVLHLGHPRLAGRFTALPAWRGSLQWLPGNRLSYAGDGRILVYSSALRPIGRIDGWNANATAVHGSTVFGIRADGAVISAALPSGTAQVVRRLPGKPSVMVSATAD